MNTFHKLIEQAGLKEEVTVAVVKAEDREVLRAVEMATERELANFILIGDEKKIDDLIAQEFPSLLQNGRVVTRHAVDAAAAAEKGVQAVRDKEAAVLMKGHIKTAPLLKAVLHKEKGMRTGNVLSHVALFEVPAIERSIFVTDAAMNVAPDLQQKVQIVANAVNVAHKLGVSMPKVAPLAAVEVVNPGMQATLDAAALTQMNRRGQITGCIVDGPLALDNAISIEAARQKNVGGEVAGQADILLVSSIEAGNVLYKSLMYFGNSQVGAVIAGAKAPIVLTSRSDSAQSKLNSLAMAICSAN
ncbi:phosphate butyryltransferase [Jeotgalibacillus campisalis]|uniref:Phosphate butyryltransferase n=1 Tax=Jeotgalibacillus campisalis TaxID=220754 RepID=A0A0C2VPJ2_9BACL|nr:phosphate butyryltransferase [Jeotgalibacillus campisalis]KIL45928.1 phosphate butyryltransferase [Jeotgalibacillus campisalis]